MAAEPRRKLDYSYILGTPNDGKRYELVDGELFVNPAPTRIKPQRAPSKSCRRPRGRSTAA